jgi:hypothetical protein
MDDVLYLVHSVPKYDNTKPYVELCPSSITYDQFPGVYFTLITKQNKFRESLYYPFNFLIFSKKLLLQHNYHININDYNGYINQENTYFSWQLDDAVKKIAEIAAGSKSHVGNEVIFHDPVSLKYLCLYIQNFHNVPYEIKPKRDFTMLHSIFLPDHELYTNEPPDMTKIPFYCIPNESYYTGGDEFKISSRMFYKKMAEMCNIKVSKKDTRDQIVDKIREIYPSLYNKRETLNIDVFKDYTISWRKQGETKYT